MTGARSLCPHRPSSPRRCGPGASVAGCLAVVACLVVGGGVATAAPTSEELAASVTPLTAAIEQLRPGTTIRPVAATSRGRTAVPADVLFAFGRASVRPDGRRALVRLAQSVTSGSTTLRVIGHTDGVGAAASNRRLSLRRAQAVADVLRLGLRGSVRVVAAGRGEEDPVAAETTSTGEDDPDGRARNRRVELRFTSR